jgi:hypothetical protein
VALLSRSSTLSRRGEKGDGGREKKREKSKRERKGICRRRVEKEYSVNNCYSA